MTEEKPVVEAAKNQVLEDMKKENAEMEEVLKKRTELFQQRNELIAREMLAGKSLAGAAPPKEETPQEYAKRILRGGK